jgi:hypothetical protein
VEHDQMKRRRGLSIGLAALLGALALSGAADAGSRFPFARFWSGHPPIGDLQGWTWNPHGDTPQGQAVCDGAEHTLAQIDPAGAPPSLKFVNAQFALALDGQSSAWITTKLLTGDRVVDQATIFHPAEGFGAADAVKQNPFHVLPVPVPLTPGALVKLVVACVPVDAGPATAHCSHNPLPCTSAWVAYGVTFDGIASPPETANAVSPVFSSDCAGAGPVLDQTFSWTASGGRVNQGAAAASLSGRQGPVSFTTAPDGQLVALWTIEDFAGAGGLFVHRAVYDPDWQVLPSGTYTTRIQTECFDPAATTTHADGFSFP